MYRCILYEPIYAFLPSIMKKLQECFLTVVLPLIKSSLPSLRTFGTTVSGFSNVFCGAASALSPSLRGRGSTYGGAQIVRVHFVHLDRRDLEPVQPEVE